MRTHSISGQKGEEKSEHMFNYHANTAYGKTDVKLHTFTMMGWSAGMDSTT
jgi:hypothetical protein